MTQRSAISGDPVVFGEVLFDVFPDGRRVPGGAPFNVAWHLRGFGLHPLLVSRVGRDDAGEEIRRRMRSWGMDASALETEDSLPTGRVRVETVGGVGGGPRFHIEPDQAYDRIDGGAAMQSGAPHHAGLLYHGTLALRSETSPRALKRILEACCDLPVFVDVNLRPPWWTPKVVDSCLARARWAKVNDRELGEIAGSKRKGEGRCVEAAVRLAAARSLRLLFVTLGARGSFVVGPEGLLAGAEAVPPPAPPPDADSVGAGDAFSAVAVVGLMQQWAPATILERASRFASAICAVKGATTTERSLYREHLASWEEGGRPHGWTGGTPHPEPERPRARPR